MARPKSASTQAGPIDFNQLPDDGGAVEIRQTFQKHVTAGSGGQATAAMSEEDFETAEWLIERQTASGWAAIDTVRPRPYKPSLRQMHGEGKYRITPLDKGKPVEQLSRIELIGDPTNNRDPVPPLPAQPPATVQMPMGIGVLPAFQNPYQGFQPPPAFQESEEMPPWMQMQMQMQAEDRRAQREAEARREQRDYDRADREEARQILLADREEKRAAEAAKRAADQAAERDARTERMLNFGLQALQVLVPVLASRSAPAPQPTTDVNGQLLGALLTTVSQRPQEQGKSEFKDFLEMYRLVQEMQPEVAPQGAVDGEGLAQMLAAAGPIIAAMRGGGQDPAQVQAQVQGYARQMAQQLLTNPQALEQFVSADPKGIARSFMQVVKNNPTLHAALDEAMSELQAQEPQ
jgi:hypothetical protein